MIVGADHDYEQLMTVAGEPPPQHAIQRHYGPPPQAYAPQQAQPHYGPPQGYYPPQPYSAPPPQHYSPPPQHLQHHQAPQRHVVSEAPTRQRDFPIGFTRLSVPPGDPIEIEVKPQVLFKGKRLAVGHTNARAFVIIDIKVGKNSQLAATGEMGAEAFSALAVGTQMELDTAAPGITITLRLRNISGAAEHFFAVLYGAVME